MKRLNFFFLLILVSSFCFAQGINNNWYLNYQKGVTFNNGNSAPNILNDGQITASQTLATVSDSSGDLLFYTDGKTVWNKNHSIMQNGILSTSNSENPERIIIVKDISNSNLYYIFSAISDYVSPNVNGAYRYSTIDFSQNLDGEVILKEEFLKDETGNYFQSVDGQGTPKRITSYHNKNDNISWVVVLNKNRLLSYKIDSNGLNTTPQSISNNVIFDRSPVYDGGMKISPDGTKIAFTLRLATWTLGPDVNLFDFDSSTGEISNPQRIPVDASYDLEFSPNSNFLYIRSYEINRNRNRNVDDSLILDTKKNRGKIYRVNVKEKNDIIKNPLNPIPVVYDISYYGSIQLGPDNKIYFNNFTHEGSGLGVIHNPNETIQNLSIDNLYLSFESQNEGFLSLPQKVHETQINPCNTFPLLIERSHPESYAFLNMDNEENLIYLEELDEQVGFNNLKKIDLNGCEIWSIRAGIQSKIEVDKQNAIYLYNRGVIKKLSSNGDLVFEINQSMTDMKVSENNNLYISSGHKILLLDSSNGFQELQNSIPMNNNFVIKEFMITNNNKLFLIGYFFNGSGSFSFGNSVVSSNQSTYHILKYDIVNNTNLIPNNSLSISEGYAYQLNYDKLNDYISFFQKNIFTNNNNMLKILDTNLNIIRDITLQNTMTVTNSDYNNNNDLLFTQNSKLYKLEANTNNPPIEYPEITIDNVLLGPGSFSTDNSSNIYIIIGSTFPNPSLRYIAKLDPITGQLIRNTSGLGNSLTLEKESSTINIFPNSTKGNINIISSEDIEDMVIFSKIGVPFISKKSINRNEFTINISNLPSDIYILKIRFKNGKRIERRIIKE